MTIKPDMPVWISDSADAKLFPPTPNQRLVGWPYPKERIDQIKNWLANRTWQWVRGTQGAFYDYVVGTVAQVDNGQATHTVATLIAAAGSVADNAKILFLEGVHAAGANLTFTANHLTIVGENPGAILDLAGGFGLTVSGANCFVGMCFANASAGKVSIQGAGSKLFSLGLPLTAVALGPQASCETTGTGGGVQINGSLGGTLALAPSAWPTFRADRNGANQTVGTGIAAVATRIAFPNTSVGEVYDPNGNFDVTTNIGRFTPTVAGKYRLEASVALQVQWTAFAPLVDIEVQLFKNGSGGVLLADALLPKAQVDPTGAQTYVLKVAAEAAANGSSDYFEVWYVRGALGSGTATDTVIGAVGKTVFSGARCG